MVRVCVSSDGTGSGCVTGSDVYFCTFCPAEGEAAQPETVKVKICSAAHLRSHKSDTWVMMMMMISLNLNENVERGRRLCWALEVDLISGQLWFSWPHRVLLFCGSLCFVTLCFSLNFCLFVLDFSHLELHLDQTAAVFLSCSLSLGSLWVSNGSGSL